MMDEVQVGLRAARQKKRSTNGRCGKEWGRNKQQTGTEWKKKLGLLIEDERKYRKAITVQEG